MQSLGLVGRRMLRAALAVAVAAIFAAAPTKSEPVIDAEGRTPAPIVDHHQHLTSPALAAIMNRAPLPQIEIPSDIAQLLQRRANLSNNAATLAAVFTEDVLFLGPGQRAGWIRGRDAAALYVSQQFYPGYRITPVWFEGGADRAELAGYYTRGEAESVRHPGYLSMVLRKGGDGVWRIAEETPVFPGPRAEPSFDGAALVAMLDEAGIERAVVLSEAYSFDGVIPVAGDVYAAVRAENDWTAHEVARFPNRLIGFCSFNPLARYAETELRRCAASGAFRGLKLHLGTSGVNLNAPADVAKLRQIFASANRLHLAIVIHLAASADYGPEQARTFLQDVLPAAPDVPVVVAHLWGGAGYSAPLLNTFVDAVTSGAPATRNLYFDVAQTSFTPKAQDRAEIVAAMRRIGLSRIFYGSDGPQGGGAPPAQMWADLQVKLPLTHAEMVQLAANVAPFARPPAQ